MHRHPLSPEVPVQGGGLNVNKPTHLASSTTIEFPCAPYPGLQPEPIGSNFAPSYVRNSWLRGSSIYKCLSL